MHGSDGFLFHFAVSRSRHEQTLGVQVVCNSRINSVEVVCIKPEQLVDVKNKKLYAEPELREQLLSVGDCILNINGKLDIAGMRMEMRTATHIHMKVHRPLLQEQQREAAPPPPLWQPQQAVPQQAVPQQPQWEAASPPPPWQAEPQQALPQEAVPQPWQAEPRQAVPQEAVPQPWQAEPKQAAPQEAVPQWQAAPPPPWQAEPEKAMPECEAQQSPPEAWDQTPEPAKPDVVPAHEEPMEQVPVQKDAAMKEAQQPRKWTRYQHVQEDGQTIFWWFCEQDEVAFVEGRDGWAEGHDLVTGDQYWQNAEQTRRFRVCTGLEF